MTKNQSLLKEQFPAVDWSFDLILANKTYFRLGGCAEIFYKVKEIDLLKKILVFCDEQSIPWIVVGGLSNVVVADSGIKGLVLQMACDTFSLIQEDDRGVTFQAEAGIKTNQLVMKVAKLGGTGLEGFIGVPGTLGGAIYNNAHYLDFLIGDYIKEVIVFHVKNNKEIIFSHEKCKLAYEHSIFQEDSQLVILSAEFSLNKDDPNKIEKKIMEAQIRRLNTQPLNYPSSGCIFRNPHNTEYLKKIFPQFANQEFIPAGFLIDQAGLKEERRGAIVVSNKHAAFLVNLTEQLKVAAKTSDLKKLIALIRSTVKEKFQVELEEEVFYLGKD
jgi:UDP-N-acetylmuramate dehydrogenase